MNQNYFKNIETLTKENNNFRKVISTNIHLQLVLMSLKPNEDIGLEAHNNLDQFFRIEEGNGLAIIGNNKFELSDGSVVIVPAGTKHNIINTSNNKPLKLYTLYAPPNHPSKRIDVNKPLEIHHKLKKYF